MGQGGLAWPVAHRTKARTGSCITLLARLADAFHLVAPDYPGFGHSDAPSPSGFPCTFDHLAEITGRFTEKLGLDRYILFLQDYGGPVGFRLAIRHRWSASTR